MAFDAEQISRVARELASRFYGQGNVTATMNLDDLREAIESIDNSMDTVINTIPGSFQTKTIKQALVDALPQPFQGQSTAAQKAAALALWGFEEAGVI